MVSPRLLKCSQGSWLRCHLSSQPGRSVVTLFGRLAGASLIPSGGSEGVGRGTAKCSLLGIVVNLKISSLVPSLTTFHSGFGSGQPIFADFLTPMRIETVHEHFPGFSVLQKARRGLLGRLTSLCHLVPGVGFVFALSNFVFESVAIVDESVSLAWTDSIRSDLQWWSDVHNILAGLSLATPHSDHYFWFDASDQA